MTHDQNPYPEEAPMPKLGLIIRALVVALGLGIGHLGFTAPKPVAELIKAAKPSVVTVVHAGRGQVARPTWSLYSKRG